MKTLVAYFSASGITASVAKEVASAANAVEKSPDNNIILIIIFFILYLGFIFIVIISPIGFLWEV